MIPIILSLEKVAETLAVSKTTVQDLVRKNDLPKPRMISANRVGWLTREIEAWAESRPVSTNLPPPNTGAPKPR